MDAAIYHVFHMRYKLIRHIFPDLLSRLSKVVDSNNCWFYWNLSDSRTYSGINICSDCYWIDNLKVTKYLEIAAILEPREKRFHIVICFLTSANILEDVWCLNFCNLMYLIFCYKILRNSKLIKKSILKIHYLILVLRLITKILRMIDWMIDFDKIIWLK